MAIGNPDFYLVRFVTASAPGTGAFTVGAAQLPFRTPAAAGIPDQTPVSYTAWNSTFTQVEYGSGIYSASTTSISRTPTEGTGTLPVDFTTAPFVWLGGGQQLVGDTWIDFVTPPPAAQTPTVGVIEMYAGATAPANYLLCNGQSVSTTTFAALFAVIGFTFGGSGSSFNVPNLQNSFPIGAGTTAALAATGGAESAVLTIAQLPSHTHGATISDPGHSHTYVEANSANVQAVATGVSGGSGSANTSTSTTGIGVTIGATGSGSPVSTLPPYVGVNFIIRFQ
jgi:microcystin-dependent protein